MLVHAASLLRGWWEHFYPILLRGDTIPIVAAGLVVLVFAAHALEARRRS